MYPVEVTRVKGEGLDLLEERMRAMNSDKNEVYKVLGCEQADKVDKGKVLERVKCGKEQRGRW